MRPCAQTFSMGSSSTSLRRGECVVRLAEMDDAFGRGRALTAIREGIYSIQVSRSCSSQGHRSHREGAVAELFPATAPTNLAGRLVSSGLTQVDVERVRPRFHLDVTERCLD